jgi:AcrR family transcriptional regulator
MSPSESGSGLRERKRVATRRRIAREAARLALEQGAPSTIDQIATAADVGRASIFRHFDSKEWAIAEGLGGMWFDRLVAEIALADPTLAPVAAVRAAITVLGGQFDADRELVLSIARLSRSTEPLRAWTEHVHVAYEAAVAAALLPRFDAPAGAASADDPTVRLTAALVVACVRLAVDDWIVDPDRDLSALMLRYLDTPPFRLR